MSHPKQGPYSCTLIEARVTLNKIKEYLPGGAELVARSESSYIELDDLASEIDKLAGSINADPLRLSQVNSRLDTIYSLIQKHRVKDLGELIDKREEIKQLVKTIETGDERLAGLENPSERQRQNY